jgi:hypothetical protein
VIFLGNFSFVKIFLKNYRVTMFMFRKYNGFVNKARASACMHVYFPRANGAERCSGRKPGAMVIIPSRLFTPGETKALAKSKVHQWSRAWVTNGGWSSSLISKIRRTVMNSEHWLVKFKICSIATAWRQRNSKHFLIWWFLANIFHFTRFCEFQKLFKKKGRKNRLKQ